MPIERPTDQEDEFFFKMDMELIRKRRDELNKKREAEARDKDQNIHWMKCPKCGSDLEEVNHGNVMIDRCTTCRGIWLDAGELELLTEGQAQLTKGFISRLFG